MTRRKPDPGRHVVSSASGEFDGGPFRHRWRCLTCGETGEAAKYAERQEQVRAHHRSYGRQARGTA